MESSEREVVGGMGREWWWNEKKVELRLGLGPPGEEENNWSPSVKGRHTEMDHHHQSSLLSLGPPLKTTTDSFRTKQQQHHHPKLSSSFLHLSESSSSGTKVLDFRNPENISPAVPAGSQKRTAASTPPVVGWPPIRSSRRNLASKQACESPKPSAEAGSADNHTSSVEAAASGNGKGLFVKVNMDGVPIGRKVDLKAYDSYAKLSSAVDELFTGLLAAQADSSSRASKEKGVKEITGILNGNGEYTLVYEDTEGDRMLVGDVPWHMFVSTVKRLRVLKSSDVSALTQR